MRQVLRRHMPQIAQRKGRLVGLHAVQRAVQSLLQVLPEHHRLGLGGVQGALVPTGALLGQAHGLEAQGQVVVGQHQPLVGGGRHPRAQHGLMAVGTGTGIRGKGGFARPGLGKSMGGGGLA